MDQICETAGVSAKQEYSDVQFTIATSDMILFKLIIQINMYTFLEINHVCETSALLGSAVLHDCNDFWGKDHVPSWKVSMDKNTTTERRMDRDKAYVISWGKVAGVCVFS